MEKAIIEEIVIFEDEQQMEVAAKLTPVERASRVLRYIGAVLLLGSAVAFSLQGWASWGSVLRHFAFIGFALSLSGLGMFCGLAFKEDKGARTFLGVAVAIVPALFAQLGAMLYAFVHAEQHKFPDFLKYSAPALPTLTGILILSIAVSAVIAYIGFRVYLGTHARTLTGLFIASNVAILIPLRGDGITAVLVGLQLLLLTLIDWRRVSKTHESRTWEGYAARGILLLPSVFLLGRSALLYAFGGYSVALCISIFALAALHKALSRRDSRNAPAYRFTSVVAFCAVWANILSGICSSLGIHRYSRYSDSALTQFYLHFRPLIELLPIAAICAALSFLFLEKGRGYRGFAGLIACYISIRFMVNNGDVLSSFICLSLGGLMLFAAFVLEEKGLLLTGALAFVMGLAFQCQKALVLYTFSPWATLAVSGVAVVGLAVYLERNGAELYRRASLLGARITQWQ